MDNKGVTCYGNNLTIEEFEKMTLEEKNIYLENLFERYYKAQINYMNRVILKKIERGEWS